MKYLSKKVLNFLFICVQKGLAFLRYTCQFYGFQILMVSKIGEQPLSLEIYFHFEPNELIWNRLSYFFTSIGTVEYDRISKKFPNPFWKDCLISIKPLMLEHLKNDPEYFSSYPIWGSSLFVMKSAICNKNLFNNVGSFINTPSDILINSETQVRFLTDANVQRQIWETSRLSFLYFS